MKKKRKHKSPSDRLEKVRDRVRKHRAASPPKLIYCSICGGVMRRGGLSARFGFHQKCDRNEFQRRYRSLKKTKEENKKMKTAIVYHSYANGDCPDGTISAWIAHRFLSVDNEVDLYPFVYKNNEDWDDEDIEKLLGYQQIFFVDFTLPDRALRSLIFHSQAEIVVIDHHSDKFENLNEVSFLLSTLLLDQDQCGATLSWKHFYPDEPVPWFLPYVRQRDIGADGYYEGSIPESEAINVAISTRASKFGRGAVRFPFYEELMGLSLEKLLEEGMPQIAARDAAIEAYAIEWEKNIDSNWLNLPEVERVLPLFDLRNHPELIRHYSVLGTKLCREFGFECAAIVVDDTGSVSLRSPSNCPPCLPIAKALGGGGHPHACGFKLRIEK